MSSSPSRAPLPSAARTRTEPPQFSPFPYDDVVTGTSHNPARSGAAAGKGEANAAGQDAERESRARALGRQEGEMEARARFEQLLAQERSAIAAAVAGFAQERAAYYGKIEAEAVQLALSMARKILHREAHIDPLLLMGIVRVALEKIESATKVVLAVHPQQAPEWRRYVAASIEAKRQPEIVEDPALAMEGCELRTSMGTAQLGVELQLKEIEQGFTDLLAARPGAKG